MRIAGALATSAIMEYISKLMKFDVFPRNIIVLAGKGHETYQEIMGVKRPFDEKVVVKELLKELGQ